MKGFPVVLLGIEYWSPLIVFINETLLKKRAISKSDLELFHVTDSPTEAVSFIKKVVTKEFGLKYSVRQK